MFTFGVFFYLIKKCKVNKNTVNNFTLINLFLYEYENVL